jgi:hypothetical protein
MNSPTTNLAPRWGIGIVGVAWLLSLVFFAFCVWRSFDPAILEEPGPGLIFILLMFILTVFGLILFVTTLVSVLRLDWWRSVTRAIALVFAVLLIVRHFIAADYIHLIVMYPHYKAVIAGRTGPISFDWGSVTLGWMPPWRTDRTLVYDASGETVMKAKRENYNDIETIYMFWHFFINEDSTPGG